MMDDHDGFLSADFADTIANGVCVKSSRGQPGWGTDTSSLGQAGFRLLCHCGPALRCARSADFPVCRIADFPVGRAREGKRRVQISGAIVFRTVRRLENRRYGRLKTCATGFRFKRARARFRARIGSLNYLARGRPARSSPAVSVRQCCGQDGRAPGGSWVAPFRFRASIGTMNHCGEGRRAADPNFGTAPRGPSRGLWKAPFRFCACIGTMNHIDSDRSPRWG